MRNLVEVARAAVARAHAAEQKTADQVQVVTVPALPIQQPTPWPGYRCWQITRATGEQFGVFVPRGATIPEMAAFYCGCVCVPER